MLLPGEYNDQPLTRCRRTAYGNFSKAVKIFEYQPAMIQQDDRR
jgi:hypothetical protein